LSTTEKVDVVGIEVDVCNLTSDKTKNQFKKWLRILLPSSSITQRK
jgi:hypothetical protein